MNFNIASMLGFLDPYCIHGSNRRLEGEVRGISLGLVGVVLGRPARVGKCSVHNDLYQTETVAYDCHKLPTTME